MRFSKLLVAAMVAAAISIPAHADPAAYHFESAGASAYLERGGVSAWIDGWTFPSNGDVSLCVQVTHEGSGRADFGCGTGTVEISPALQTAHLAGSIASEVFDTDTWTYLGDSMISVDVTLDGTGVPEIGNGAGYGIGTYGSTPTVEAFGGLSVSRTATATGSASSKAMCTLPQKAPSRSKYHKRQRRTTSEPCSSGTGLGAIDPAAFMQESLYAGAGNDSGECGKDC